MFIIISKQIYLFKDFSKSTDHLKLSFTIWKKIYILKVVYKIIKVNYFLIFVLFKFYLPKISKALTILRQFFIKIENW